MKVCAVIAEYNPLHLGHVGHLDYIKNELKAERVVVIMSGDFTQRGEPAVLDKYTRARHAIIAGADAVIELPAVFSTANAENFAKGAVNILSALNFADGLCFGVESGSAEDYERLAEAMNDESKEFKRALKESLEKGVSLAKAKFEAVKALGGKFDEKLIASPNNILALEYAKADLSSGGRLKLYPMIRTGDCDHNDVMLKKGITSATSIRAALKAGEKKKLKKCVPPFVYEDLTEYPFAFDKMIMTAIYTAKKEDMAEIADCTEGLENRIKALAKDNKTVEELVRKASTKRYPATRIRRILINNLLGIKAELTAETLKSGLYAKVLAVNADKTDIIRIISEKAEIPVLTRKSDEADLKRAALRSLEKDVLAADLYSLATGASPSGRMLLV